MAGGSLLPKRDFTANRGSNEIGDAFFRIPDASEFVQMSGNRWSGARGHDIPRRETRLMGVSRGVRHCSALLKRTKPAAAQSMHIVRS